MLKWVYDYLPSLLTFLFGIGKCKAKKHETVKTDRARIVIVFSSSPSLGEIAREKSFWK